MMYLIYIIFIVKWTWFLGGFKSGFAIIGRPISFLVARNIKALVAASFVRGFESPNFSSKTLTRSLTQFRRSMVGTPLAYLVIKTHDSYINIII